MLDIYPFQVITVSFLVWSLMILLNRFFFKPIGAMIEQRESQEEQEKDQLKEFLSQVATLTAATEHQLRAARIEAQSAQARIIAQGASMRDELIEETRQRIHTEFDQEMAGLQGQMEAARITLLADLGRFSTAIKGLF